MHDLFMRAGSDRSNRKGGSTFVVAMTHVFRASGLLVLLEDVVTTVPCMSRLVTARKCLSPILVHVAPQIESSC